MKKRPVIGISGSFMVDKSGNFAGYRRSYVNEDYVSSVIKNEGVPYIVPMNNDTAVIEAQVERIDGLILSGGHDVTPRFYGQEPHKLLGEVSPERDEFDFALLQAALAKNIPVLGICRGFQLMNVYFGGTLYQDASLNPDVYIKHNQVLNPTQVSHSVDLASDTKLGGLFGCSNMLVNSFHHQIIKRLAGDLKIVATSKDGVIEAFEHREYSCVVGVQWHPEMLHRNVEIMNVLFSNLIKIAAKGGRE